MELQGISNIHQGVELQSLDATGRACADTLCLFALDLEVSAGACKHACTSYSSEDC